MQKIDLAVWPRAELFRFFSAVSQPFYSVTFRVDVTNLHAYARAHGVSFYYALGYLVTDAVNAVENFRYTIRSGEVWLLDERVPSFTDLKPGSQQFHIVTLPKEGDLDSFCRHDHGAEAVDQPLYHEDAEIHDGLLHAGHHRKVQDGGKVLFVPPAVLFFRAELRELFQGVQSDADAGHELRKGGGGRGPPHAPVPAPARTPGPGSH